MCQWLPILILPYFIILLRIYRSLGKITPYKSLIKPSTRVSVVIACHNEETKLPSLLNCLNKQNYPKGLFDIIIVDDNSSDKTSVIARSFESSIDICVIKNKGLGKKQALRTGIERSESELIITCDADCTMKEKWISTIAGFFEEKKSDMIISPVVLSGGDTPFTSLQKIEFLSLQGVTAATAYSGNATMCNGANLAFTKAAYSRNSARLHDELVSGDDIFLLQALKKEKGSAISWLESIDVIVTTDSSSTLESFIRQRTRWISKAGSYSDNFTIVLSIVTFVTILLQISLLAASIFSTAFFTSYIIVTLIKSIPDLMIIRNRANRYMINGIILWFFPALIIYPFYVFIVVLGRVGQGLQKS